MGVTSPTLVSRAGITYRQLDHWTRAGYLNPGREWKGREYGSGSPRDWPPEECRVAELMGALVEAGFRVDVAARLARSGDRDKVLAALRPYLGQNGDEGAERARPELRRGSARSRR